MPHPVAKSSHLDPKVLARLGRLELVARRVVEGFLAGLHKSPYHGYSIEFAQHREYVPGDDIRHLDWKVFAKQDRYYLKQYETETNVSLLLVVDGSESMQVGSSLGNGPTKLWYASAAAASLAYLAISQQDAVGLGLFDETLTTFIPPRAHQATFQRIVHELDRRQALGMTVPWDALKALLPHLGRRGIVAIFSDGFTDVDVLIRGVTQLRHRGHEVLFFHVLAADEIEFPFTRMTKFKGLEAQGELLAEPKALKKAYLAALEAFRTKLRRGLVKEHIDYIPLSTGKPLDAALAAYLSGRKSRRR